MGGNIGVGQGVVGGVGIGRAGQGSVPPYMVGVALR